MSPRWLRMDWAILGMAAWWAWLPGMAYAQEPDTTPPKFVLPPITVSVTRSSLPLTKTPHAVQLVDKSQISDAKPTWALDPRVWEPRSVRGAGREGVPRRHPPDPPRRPGPAHQPGPGGGGPDRSAAGVVLGAVRQCL